MYNEQLEVEQNLDYSNKLDDEKKIDYSILYQIKLLLNNERFSDVSFSVGEKNQIIYAHKNILAAGSPVMEKMFFGNLAEKDYPIKIPDLTPNGFLNMLRYMYGYDIDFDFSILYEVYMAADKYLVYNLTDKIFQYIKSNLNEFNCCLIYDQLVKINKDEGELDLVQNMVKVKTKETFSSEFFKKISKECLIDILKMESLNIEEIDILKNCLNWIEAELLRNKLSSTLENRRSIFKEIRPFIRFSKITIQHLIDFKKINSLLSSEEIGDLFLHLADNEKPIPFECKTLREWLKVFTVQANNIDRLCNDNISKKDILLNTNQEIIITNIQTLLNFEADNLVLNIYNEKNEIINIKHEKTLSAGYWNFKLVNFRVVPNTDYKISFEFSSYNPDKYFSTLSKLEVNDNNNKIILNLNFDYYHPIDNITLLTIN